MVSIQARRSEETRSKKKAGAHRPEVDRFAGAPATVVEVADRSAVAAVRNREKYDLKNTESAWTAKKNTHRRKQSWIFASFCWGTVQTHENFVDLGELPSKSAI